MTSTGCSSSGRAPRLPRQSTGAAVLCSRCASHPSRSTFHATSSPAPSRTISATACSQHRSARLHHRADRDRDLARREHRRPAPDPGLRADGPPRLRQDHDAAHLGRSPAGPPGEMASGRHPQPCRPPRPAPLNSGRRSDIRAFDPARGGLEGVIGARCPPTVPLWTTRQIPAIYQRLSDVLHIRSGRHDHR